jgi:hypothetical protein
MRTQLIYTFHLHCFVVFLLSITEAMAGLLGIARKEGVFDVAIVRAGFASLTSALLLGWYLLPAVIFDGGATRNFMTRSVHDYPGFENASPRVLIGRMCSDVKKQV